MEEKHGCRKENIRFPCFSQTYHLCDKSSLESNSVKEGFILALGFKDVGLWLTVGLRQGREAWVQNGGGACGRGVCSLYDSHDAGKVEGYSGLG